jgi:hypothetical protein
MKEVICVKISDKYKHHQKLVIGDIYLLRNNINSIVIYTKDKKWIGFYPQDFFIDIDEHRDNQILKLLG